MEVSLLCKFTHYHFCFVNFPPLKLSASPPHLFDSTITFTSGRMVGGELAMG